MPRSRRRSHHSRPRQAAPFAGPLLAGTNTGVWQLRDATNRLFDSGFD